MADEQTHALSDVLDRIENSAQGDRIKLGEVVKALGQHSFAALMLIFSLISSSPASAIPGLTATVGVVVALLVGQMIFGRQCVWLPDLITRRELPADKLRGGIGWLRKPVGMVERLARPRLRFLLHRPLSLLPLGLILVLALFMPVMEIVPMSGSIASAVIAIFAAGLLTRDGALILLSLILLFGVPLVVWYFGFGP